MQDQKPLPNDFWKTGPLCKAHGGDASMISCKACAMSLPYQSATLLTAVWVPFEVLHVTSQKGKKCMDLPRFCSPEEVKDFLQFNNQELANRLIRFEEYGDAWALKEFMDGVGRLPKWKYGPPLAPDAEPMHKDLYEQVKKLSS